MRLSAEQLGAFHEQGYLVVRQLADPATLRHLAAEVDGLHERMAQHPPPEVGLSWEEGLPQDQPPRIRQLMNSERVSPTIDRILTSERMLDIVAELIGPRIILFHSKLMMKSARDGSFTPWHQDWSYWKGACREPVQVNCMLSLDAAAVDNGCIRFVPGSHRQGFVEHSRLQSRSFNLGLPGGLDAYPTAVPAPTEPGDGVFFGSLVIHGSGPNSSDQHRRANTFAFDRIGNFRHDDLNARARVLR